MCHTELVFGCSNKTCLIKAVYNYSTFVSNTHRYDTLNSSFIYLVLIFVFNEICVDW